MYNCIHLRRWLPDAAYCCRFYTIKLESLYPRVFLISDGCILFEQHTVKRHINSSYLRFFAQIALGKLRSVSVSKTYRHLRPGGITSGAGVICQQHDVSVT